MWYDDMCISVEQKGWKDMRAVVTVIGKDMVGILGKVATECANHNANVIEVTQSVLQELFAMVMLVDITDLSSPFPAFSSALAGIGESMGMQVHVMHEEIFNSMHRV